MFGFKLFPLPISNVSSKIINCYYLDSCKIVDYYITVINLFFYINTLMQKILKK